MTATNNKLPEGKKAVVFFMGLCMGRGVMHNAPPLHKLEKMVSITPVVLDVSTVGLYIRAIRAIPRLCGYKLLGTREGRTVENMKSTIATRNFSIKIVGRMRGF